MRRPVLVLLVAAALAACAPRSADKGLAARIAAFPQPTAAGLERLKALPAPYRDADPAAGRAAFALCADCHALKTGEPDTTGPNLVGVFDAPAASRTAYDYSPALRASRITWDAPHLDRWLFNPHEMLPGTRMSFIGIRNDRKRRDLLAYLIALTGDAPPAHTTP